jgi:hypothetical protein
LQTFNKKLTKSLAVLFVFLAGVLFQQLIYARKKVARIATNIAYYIKNINTSENKYVLDKDYKWKRLTADAMFPARDGAGCVVHNGKIYLIGGWNAYNQKYFPRQTANDVWQSVDGKKWVQVKSNSFTKNFVSNSSDWEGRHIFGCVSFLGWIYIIGGDTNQGHHQKDIWRSKDGQQWELVTSGDDLEWQPRYNFMTAVSKDEIFIFGGQTKILPESSNSMYLSRFNGSFADVWSSKDGRKWTNLKLKGNGWSPRGMVQGNCIYRNSLVIFSGALSSEPTNLEGLKTREIVDVGDLWMSEDVSIRPSDSEVLFDFIGYPNIDSKGFMCVQEFDNKFWVFGGFNAELRDINSVYDTSDFKSWTKFKEVPFSPTHAASVVVLNNSIITIGGSSLRSEVWEISKLSE